jgi:hypothetical protein
VEQSRLLIAGAPLAGVTIGAAGIAIGQPAIGTHRCTITNSHNQLPCHSRHGPRAWPIATPDKTQWMQRS